MTDTLFAKNLEVSRQEKRATSRDKTPRVSSLEEALRYALVLKPSPHFLRLNEGRQTAQEEYSGAQAEWLPTLTASAAYEKPLIRFVGKKKEDEAGPDGIQGDVTLSQSLFKGGGTLSGVEAAHYGVKAADEDFQDNFQKLVLSILQLCTALPAQKELVITYEKSAANLRTLLDQSRVRYKLGDKDITEVSASEAELARAEARYDEAKKQMIELERHFQDIVGCSWSATSSLPTRALLPLPRSLEEALQEAKRCNPELQAVMAQEKRAAEAVDVASSAAWPQVTAYASYGVQKRSLFSEGTSLPEHGARVGLRLEWSLLNAARSSTIAKAKVRKGGLRYQREMALRLCLRKVKDSWDAYSQKQRQLQYLAIQVAAGEVTLRGIKESHRLGSKSLIDVLYTEEKNTSAKEGLIKGQQALVNAAHDLLAVMGKLRQETLMPLLKKKK